MNFSQGSVRGSISLFGNGSGIAECTCGKSVVPAVFVRRSSQRVPQPETRRRGVRDSSSFFSVLFLCFSVLTQPITWKSVGITAGLAGMLWGGMMYVKSEKEEGAFHGLVR